jgi:hypothetical protein
MSITTSLEVMMNAEFDKFYNNVKFYDYFLSEELQWHLDALENRIYSLASETRTTEMEERFEDGYLKGMIDGSQDAHDEGYNMGYDQGHEHGYEQRLDEEREENA